MSRQTADAAERLVFVNALLDTDTFYASVLTDWFEGRLTHLPAQWSNHITHAGKPVALVRALSKSGRLPYGLADQAVMALRSHASYAYAWDCLWELQEVVPESFPTALTRLLRTECEEWATLEMTQNLDAVHTTDELSEIRRVAEKAGIHTDKVVFDAAYQEVDSRQTHGDFEPDPPRLLQSDGLAFSFRSRERGDRGPLSAAATWLVPCLDSS